MPKFPPFRFFGTFPQVASNESVPCLGQFGGSQSNSSISSLNQSLPMWWLLYKLTMNVNIYLQNPPQAFPKSGSANFDVVFTSPESPKNKICREENVIAGNGSLENVATTGDWPVLAGFSPVEEEYFALAPFLCDSLHVNFYCQIAGMASIIAEAYITSSLNELGTDDSGIPLANPPFHNLNFSEITIETPYSDPITLYGVVNVYDYTAGDGGVWENIGSGEVTVKNVEWWEVE